MASRTGRLLALAAVQAGGQALNTVVEQSQLRKAEDAKYERLAAIEGIKSKAQAAEKAQDREFEINKLIMNQEFELGRDLTQHEHKKILEGLKFGNQQTAKTQEQEFQLQRDENDRRHDFSLEGAKHGNRAALQEDSQRHAIETQGVKDPYVQTIEGENGQMMGRKADGTVEPIDGFVKGKRPSTEEKRQTALIASAVDKFEGAKGLISKFEHSWKWNKTDQDSRAFNNSIKAAVQDMLYLKSGAAATVGEVDIMMSIYGPELLDSKEIVLSKIERFERELDFWKQYGGSEFADESDKTASKAIERAAAAGVKPPPGVAAIANKEASTKTSVPGLPPAPSPPSSPKVLDLSDEEAAEKVKIVNKMRADGASEDEIRAAVWQ